MSVLGRVSRHTGDRGVVATERPPAYLFEPSFIREQLREAREVVLQEEEDYGYRGGVGTGDDWEGDHE